MSTVLDRWPIVGRRENVATVERLLRARRDGVLIYGPAGVGKTRLAEECRHDAEAAGFPTIRLVATRTAAGLPLSAVSALFPSGVGASTALDPIALFEGAAVALRERHGERPLVTVVDDLHLLDGPSLSLLAYLLGQRTIFLIATVRTGEAMPDLITGLWRDDRLARMDLDVLDRADVDTLLHLVLGGPMRAGTGRQFWMASGGNALYVRELLLGALDAGVLVDREGVWHLEGALSSTGRLLDLVEARVGSLRPEARGVVELLALCQPVSLAYLERSVSADVLESLEQSGLAVVSVELDEVRLAHPLHGEVVRAAMPTLRARAILRSEADRLEAAPHRPPSDDLRIALWRLDADGRADTVRLRAGAHLARYAQDFRTARRLVEAIPWTERDSADALLLGEAFYELGSFTDAEELLSRSQGQAVTEAVELRLAVTRSKNLLWGLCDPEAALAVNADALRYITEAPLLEELHSDRAAVLLFSGFPQAALEALGELPGTDLRTRVGRAIVSSVALALVGRTSEAIAMAETGFADHLALGDELAIAHPGTHIVNKIFALTEAGRLAEAQALAEAGAEVAASDRVPIAQIWFAATLGRVALLQGRPMASRNHHAEAAGLADAHHFKGPRRLALGGVAIACATMANLPGAQRALAEQAVLPPFGFLGPEHQLADAWVLVAAGRTTEATRVFLAAADGAAGSGHLTTESWLLHDLVRACGGDHHARLERLAAATDSELVHARAQHAAAIHGGDPLALGRAAEAFLALGMNLVAAEAVTASVDAFRRAGQRRAATSAARWAAELAERCEGATTPGLVQTDVVVALTGREREIAMMAASGVASRDISERLFLSVRTVNNHLQRAYTKLGVTNRTDLGAALRRAP